MKIFWLTFTNSKLFSFDNRIHLLSNPPWPSSSLPSQPPPKYYEFYEKYNLHVVSNLFIYKPKFQDFLKVNFAHFKYVSVSSILKRTSHFAIFFKII